TISLDIGTAAGNGTVSFSNVGVNTAGNGKSLSATATALSSALSSTFSINPATLTATVTVSNKVYDASTDAIIASRSLSGVLGGDNVQLSGGSAAFATKTVGNGKSINVSGLGLSGTSAGNYALASTTVSTNA